MVEGRAGIGRAAVDFVAQSQLAPLQTPEFARASQRFHAYIRDVCKIS